MPELGRHFRYPPPVPLTSSPDIIHLPRGESDAEWEKKIFFLRALIEIDWGRGHFLFDVPTSKESFGAST